ncbi:MAG: hypothetical protein MJ152_04075 [Clostridia bacterium]|nr:hypothetical protein [Clostridia bacterium]
MDEMLELALSKIDNLEHLIEKYFQILKVDNELDFVIKGGYVTESEIDNVINGTYELEVENE